MNKRYFITMRKGEGRSRNPYYMKVFEIMPNREVQGIGHEEYNQASFKGEEAIAYSVLHDEGIVSNKDYKASNGYYHRSKANVIITIL